MMRALPRLARQLRSDRSGVAFVEFAFAMPVLIGVSLYGLEAANYVLACHQISQMAAAAADTASRGASTIDEGQINEVMLGAKRIGERIKFAANGRIILSDLEPNDANTRQYIRWQRCSGALNRNSSYGVPKNGSNNTITDGSEMTNVNQTNSAPTNGTASTPTTGMGPAGEQIMAQSGMAVMFVEVLYTYQPVVSAAIMGRPVIRYTSAFNVRQRTNYGINDGGLTSAQKSLCSRFTA